MGVVTSEREGQHVGARLQNPMNSELLGEPEGARDHHVVHEVQRVGHLHFDQNVQNLRFNQNGQDRR